MGGGGGGGSFSLKSSSSNNSGECGGINVAKVLFVSSASRNQQPQGDETANSKWGNRRNPSYIITPSNSSGSGVVEKDNKQLTKNKRAKKATDQQPSSSSVPTNTPVLRLEFTFGILFFEEQLQCMMGDAIGKFSEESRYCSRDLAKVNAIELRTLIPDKVYDRCVDDKVQQTRPVRCRIPYVPTY